MNKDLHSLSRPTPPFSTSQSPDTLSLLQFTEYTRPFTKFHLLSKKKQGRGWEKKHSHFLQIILFMFNAFPCSFTRQSPIPFSKPSIIVTTLHSSVPRSTLPALSSVFFPKHLFTFQSSIIFLFIFIVSGFDLGREGILNFIFFFILYCIFLLPTMY